MLVIRAHGERAASGCDRLDRRTDDFTRKDGAHTPMRTRTERQANIRLSVESELVWLRKVRPVPIRSVNHDEHGRSGRNGHRFKLQWLFEIASASDE